MKDRLMVVELTCQNIMKARSVRIKPDGAPVVVIGGNNGEGKTSLMNSLVVGLCGKREWVSMPVSKGEQQGAVRIGLGRKGEKPLYIITQLINPDSLKIERTDGQPLGGTPRAVLDAKLGQLAFDPMALIRMKPEDQAKLVRKVYGIDTDAIDVEYNVVYEDRRQANSSLKAQTTILDEYALMDFSKLPAEPIDVGKSMNELSAKREMNTSRNALDASIENDTASIGRMRAELEEAETKLSRLKVERGSLGSVEGIEELEQTISTAGQVNAALDQKAKAEHQREVVDLVEKNVATLNAKLDELKASKSAALVDAELPQGLSFATLGLELDGVPFEQASTTEQITIGFELSIKDDPEIGITCVREASLLDKKHRAYIEELAEKHGMQAWFEVVGDEDPNAFIIENGEVIRVPIEVETKPLAAGSIEPGKLVE